MTTDSQQPESNDLFFGRPLDLGLMGDKVMPWNQNRAVRTADATAQVRHEVRLTGRAFTSSLP